jgi:hypothetical protein
MSQTPAMISLPASSSAVVTDRAVDGLMVAAIRPSPWAALRAFRTAMADLHRGGRGPRVSWVLALSTHGRIVPGNALEAAVLVLGYRLTSPR